MGGNSKTVVVVTARTGSAHATETLQSLRFGEQCGGVHLSGGRQPNTALMGSLLRSLDKQIEELQKQIQLKERWETQIIKRTDVRAGAASDGDATEGGVEGEGHETLNISYLTDVKDEFIKKSVLVGAEEERMQLEQCLQQRQQLLGL